jgi:hypothetical protein
MKVCGLIFLGVLLCGPLLGQTHSSVNLENQIYYVLEQTEARGLCPPLSGIRPYTHSVIITAINEILNSPNAEKLKNAEREILEQYLDKFGKPKNGLDWQKGAWYGESAIGKSDAPVSAHLGVSADMQGSAGIYSADKRYFGAEIWVQAFMNGDLGHNASYNFTFEGGLMRAPRGDPLGTYDTYYKGFFPDEEEEIDEFIDSEYVNRRIDVYSEPLTHFPYTYKKRWDGSVYFFNSLSSFRYWPDDIAGGYNLPAEFTASFFDNKLIARMGRISHEWGSVSPGSSLAFNQMARPFLAVEAEFNPVSWFGISSLVGALEYSNYDGIKVSSMTFQNAFSITMLQLRYKEYLFFDIVDAVIWPKRFEPGYMLPVVNSFLYQNNIGDFDNMALAFNLKAQYPGLGNIWFSFFMDEMNFTSNLLTLDRQMFAMQGGANVPLPFLSFSSLKMSYTWVSPYCYTHNRNYNPWYGDLRMETAYNNNGVNLGYYLPPNSDEILARFQTMPVKSLVTHLQYQLIRHGADFGSSAVDGSNMYSELDPDDRNTKAVLKRFFLHDGAYQWNHIVKAGVEWNLPRLPVSLVGEAGVHYSFFTNTKAPANSGKAYDYTVISTAEYSQSTAYIIQIGVKVFPR